MYRLVSLVYRTLARHRGFIKPIALRLSNWLDHEMAASAHGDFLFSFAYRSIRRRSRTPARLTLFVIRNGLALATQVHLAASQNSRMFRTARLLNLLFRPYIRARHAPIANVYFLALLQLKLFQRIARELPDPEELDNFYLAFVAGVAHLYLMNTEAAKYFLKVAISHNDNDHSAHRMLGRVHLIEGDYDSAADEFDKSVNLNPSTVMAHQNYAGRYDVLKYEPQQWELERAGELLIYDNLLQFAEDMFLLGHFYKSFHFYQLALSVQSRHAEEMPLPRRMLKRLEIECEGFDPSLPIRLLPYEWVTQFGHIGLLDSYKKMGDLGTIVKANYVLLAPREKVSNSDYLAYWDRYFCIVRNEEIVNDLFPYQRYIGDQFMALPSDGPLAEPWTRAAAQTQIEWAERGYGPLLQLEEQHKTEGQKSLSKLGLPPGAWYVGLHVREGGFYGDGAGTISEHRSANVADYFGAIEEVTSRGGWVVRLGDTSMTPLPVLPNVIDYVQSAEKSALMDLFFLATSRFIIGTTSGLSTVAMSFGTPMLLVNCISNDWQIWTEDTDFIVKQVYDLSERRYLSLAETYRQPFQGYLVNHALLARRGFAIHSNTASDIRAAVRNKLDIVLGVTARSGEDHPLMQRYREALSDNPFMFGAAKPTLPFLEAHPELLDPLPDHASMRRKKNSAA